MYALVAEVGKTESESLVAMDEPHSDSDDKDDWQNVMKAHTTKNDK